MLDRTFQTQSIDQVFLEPEAGLAWYENGTRKLELVIGVQSPHQAAASVATLLSKNARRERSSARSSRIAPMWAAPLAARTTPSIRST